eukprot:344517-Chlamydomonas_euryale.AAC.15
MRALLAAPVGGYVASMTVLPSAGKPQQPEQSSSSHGQGMAPANLDKELKGPAVSIAKMSWCAPGAPVLQSSAGPFKESAGLPAGSIQAMRAQDEKACAQSGSQAPLSGKTTRRASVPKGMYKEETDDEPDDMDSDSSFAPSSNKVKRDDDDDDGIEVEEGSDDATHKNKKSKTSTRCGQQVRKLHRFCVLYQHDKHIYIHLYVLLASYAQGGNSSKARKAAAKSATASPKSKPARKGPGRDFGKASAKPPPKAASKLSGRSMKSCGRDTPRSGCSSIHGNSDRSSMAPPSSHDSKLAMPVMAPAVTLAKLSPQYSDLPRPGSAGDSAEPPLRLSAKINQPTPAGSSVASTFKATTAPAAETAANASAGCVRASMSQGNGLAIPRSMLPSMGMGTFRVAGLRRPRK